MNAFTFSNNQKGCTARHGASNKIKYFRVFALHGIPSQIPLYFGKDQGLARRKGKRKG
jgi:hypothetical protein